MLHKTINVGTFCSLVVAKSAVGETIPDNTTTYFDDNSKFIQIKYLREIPSFGVPANVVKVPQFGKSVSSSVGAQSDATDLEFVLNYIPSEWAASTELGQMFLSKQSFLFRLSMAEASLLSLVEDPLTMGRTPNSNLYFVAQFESLVKQSQLSDATTSTLTLSLKSKFSPISTVDPLPWFLDTGSWEPTGHWLDYPSW
jgi:hypothetical protein